MIVPMKHLTLLCVEPEKRAALAGLAELGVLHVSVEKKDGAEIADARAGADAAARAISAISAARAAKGAALSLRAGASGKVSELPLAAEINALADAYIAAQDEARTLAARVAEYEPFGDFDPGAAAGLARAGVPVALFRARRGAEIPRIEGAVARALGADKNGACGVVVGAPLPSPLPEGLAAVALPEAPLCATLARAEELKLKLDGIAKTLAGHGRDAAALKALRGEAARCGACEEYWTAFENMPVAAGAPIAHISGFVDARKSGEILAAAKERGWGAALRDPAEGELPPTLLEPPRLFRPVTALFKGLGIAPGYNECDVSVPFYIFFSIFFAMLIGDAGYGSIILAFTTLARIKLGRRAPPLARSACVLFYVFGGATVAYGVLSGTYFGIDQALLPPALAGLPSVRWLGDMDNIMRLCFTLGAAHLSLARVWNAAALFPSRKCLAEIGWTGVIWSMYMVICSILVSGFEFPGWGKPLMAASILLIALFTLNRAELKTEGAALGMLPLNIVSSMGDIISYVRLFAVGLASVKVAENFNGMASSLDLPLWAKIPLMAAILLLGHGLNFAMGALSILVHAVRLNTLEFSGAKGVTWCGIPFKPFTAKEK